MKAVLFDLDNTLIDFVYFKTECTKAALKAMKRAGLKTQATYKRLLKIYWKTGIDGNTAFSTFLRLETGHVEPKLLNTAIKAYKKRKEEVVKPYPGVIPTLKKLKKKGIKMGIVSDAPKSSVLKRMDIMKVRKYFDVIIAFDDTGAQKPNPKPFRAALKKLKVPASSVLFVGDVPLRDIKGAQAVGMKTALAKYGVDDWFKADIPKVKPDYVLNNPNDLLKYV